MAADYIGFANLPNQVHRKSVKRGFEFTLMVVGESGLGKSTLINSLFLTDLYSDRDIPPVSERLEKTVDIESSTVEIEERGIKLKLTVVDTPGFGDSLDNSECYKPILDYVNNQFNTYLKDESGLNRRNIVDNRIHCCFYFISPTGLQPIDIDCMRQLHSRVNIVPVIGKADTLTQKELRELKKKIIHEIQKYDIQIYQLPYCDDDEDADYKKQTEDLRATMPFAVVGSNATIEVQGKKVRGRRYPWGVVEVENPKHSDFVKLRTMLITHMQDLKEVTQDVHYENYRATCLSVGDGTTTVQRTARRGREVGNTDTETLSEKDKMLEAKEAELRRMQEMLAKMQQQMQGSHI